MIKSAAYLEFYLVSKKSAQRVDELFDKGLAPHGYQISVAGKWYLRDESVPAPDPRSLRRFGNPGPTEIFLLEKDRAKGSDQEIFQTFNMGMGFTIIAPEADAEAIAKENPNAKIVGRVEEGNGVYFAPGKFTYDHY